jgi:hypothetical protein
LPEHFNHRGGLTAACSNAVADAAIDIDRVASARYGGPWRVHVAFRDEVALPDGKLACLFPPGLPSTGIAAIGEFPEGEDDDSFRILICMQGRTEPHVAGLLRHELEHVRQIARSLDVGPVHRNIEILLAAAGASGTEYNEMPIERDANRAARDFVGSAYSEQALRRLAGTPEWLELTPPGAAADPETSVTEMLDSADDLARRHPDLVTVEYRDALEALRGQICTPPTG